ncbi:MAG: discoidin domain-containing protein [Candidatus Omnitrophota bacterium]
MKKISVYALFLMLSVIIMSGCAQEAKLEAPEAASVEEVAVVEKVEASEGEPVVYIEAVAAEASSFDETPDWAPEPNPMASADGDMLTRWSSNYTEGDQWVYFDLGTESTVSNVIVRWERAYATNYQILVSNDAENWTEVYNEKNGNGGSDEAKFAPVKCRYLMLLGKERVNEDWGISIWEVEIYGPKSKNLKAKMTKEAYLTKGDDESKKEEVKEVLDKLAAKPVPISQQKFQKGVVYTSWMADELANPVSDLTLAYLKEIGFDTIAIMVPAYQKELDSKEIFTNDHPGGDTPTDKALVHAIKTCHRIGLRVLLKPHVDPRTDEARINIMPSDEWFDSYEKFVVRYARMAQEHGVEIYSVGTELEATTFSAWAHRWDQVITKTKEVYGGLLTYSANWTEYKEVPFWDKMDFIGLDAYFPLAEVDEPTQEELVLAWEAIANEIDKWLNEKGLTGKGVILTEIGYPSADRAARQPWVAITNVEDQQEQADCLAATFEVLSKRSWFEGYYIWQYFPQDRWSPLGFTIKGKKAEEVVKKWLKKAE